MNCILARTLFYAQKNGYGEVSNFAKNTYSVLPSILEECRHFLWYGYGRSPNALMWPQVPPKPCPPTITLTLPGENPNNKLCVHVCNIQKHHLSCHSLQDVFLFSTYFWERLRHNFEYACDVADKVTSSWKKKIGVLKPLLLFQTNFKAKCNGWYPYAYTVTGVQP